MAKQINHDIELMAPAGSFESLHAAVNAGADSVFFGVMQLNMRSCSTPNKGNFELDNLSEVARICHEKGVKAYLTLNTILYDHDFFIARKIMDEAKKAGIDAAIIADIGAIEYAKQIGLPLHASTQLSISNYPAVEFFAQFCDTIVLARELTLPMVKVITDKIKENNLCGPSGKPLKIEVFGHGAMCVAVSGRCSMSLLTDNSSANRGACKQPCRRSYTIIDDDTQKALKVSNKYVLSPSDLCTVGALDEFANAGIKILKVEGRGRSADYVDTVIKTYREALDALKEGTYTEEKIAEWNQVLGTTYNRGFSHGFYMGKPWIEWSGVYGNKATKQKVFVGTVQHFYDKISVAEVTVEAGEFDSANEWGIIGDTTGIVRGDGVKIILDEQEVQSAKKGDRVTFKVEFKVRQGDRLYKFVDVEKNA